MSVDLDLGPHCCPAKTVGPHSYTLVESTSHVPSDCLNKCVYQRDGEAGSQYCFQLGTLPVKCTVPLPGHYPYVTVKNTLQNKITGGKVVYDSVFCRSDSISQLSPGQSWTATSRGTCLVSSVSVYLDAYTCTPYTSSGTSYSTFKVRIEKGKCEVCRSDGSNCHT